MIFNEEDFQLYVEQANPKDRLYVVVGSKVPKNVIFHEKSSAPVVDKAPKHVGVSKIIYKQVFLESEN